MDLYWFWKVFPLHSSRKGREDKSTSVSKPFRRSICWVILGMKNSWISSTEMLCNVCLIREEVLTLSHWDQLSSCSVLFPSSKFRLFVVWEWYWSIVFCLRLRSQVEHQSNRMFKQRFDRDLVPFPSTNTQSKGNGRYSNKKHWPKAVAATFGQEPCT